MAHLLLGSFSEKITFDFDEFQSTFLNEFIFILKIIITVILQILCLGLYLRTPCLTLSHED